MKFSHLLGGAMLCSSLAYAEATFGQQVQTISQDTTETLGCGGYFLGKLKELELEEYNVFFREPYFIFRDCDGTEHTVFIKCGCGYTGYQIVLYGKIYNEAENDHPNVDKLLEILEQAKNSGQLRKASNEHGYDVYEIYCM